MDHSIKETIQSSFYEFLRHFWDAVHPDPFVDNWHIKYLCDELQAVAERVIENKPKEYDLIINIPPGTSKSTICTIMFPVWCWVRKSSLRFITGSYSRDLAGFHAQRSRELILADPFRKIFGEDVVLSPYRNTRVEYETTKKGSRMAVSTGSTVTGKHAHIIIIDDPLNAAEASSKSGRDRANNWLDRSISTRKVDKEITPTILIMQRLHMDDCTGHWLNKTSKKVKHICLPAELDEKIISPAVVAENYIDRLLDPIRLSWKALENMRIDLGTFGYAGQLQQRPAPSEGGYVKKDWFRRAQLPELMLQNLTWNFVVDTAFTENTRNDPSAILAYAHDKGNWYFRNLASVRLLYPDLCGFIAKFALENGYTSASRIWIEPKANGKSVVQSLYRDTNLNVIEHKNPVKDKLSRLQQVSATIERGSVYLVQENGSDPQWITNYLDQVSAFPNARHDEEIDLTVMALNNHNRTPFISLKVFG